MKFPGDFGFIQSLYCVIVASDLGATTCLIEWRRAHQNLQASNLHASYLNAIYGGDFCPA